MATIDDIHLDSDPLDTPPTLPEWQAAVRDSIHSLEDVAANAIAESQGNWLPYTDWVDVGGAYGGLYVTRVGSLVAVEGIVKRTAALIVTANNAYQIGTLPVGFRPTHQIVGNSAYKIGTASAGTIGKLWILGTGDMHLVAIAPGTMAVDHDVTVSITFRGD